MIKINKGNTNEEYVVVTESTGEENKWKEEEVKSDLPKTIPLPTPNFTRTITTSTTPAIVDDVNNNDEIERDRTHNHFCRFEILFPSHRTNTKKVIRKLESKKRNLTTKIVTKLTGLIPNMDRGIPLLCGSPMNNMIIKKTNKHHRRLPSSSVFELPTDANLSIHHLMELLKAIISYQYRYCHFVEDYQSGHGREHDLLLIEMVAIWIAKLNRVTSNGNGNGNGNNRSYSDAISWDDKEQIAMLLESFLERSYFHSSCLIVADMHTHIGLLRQCGGQNHDFAVRSLLKALWIYTQNLNATAPSTINSTRKLTTNKAQLCEKDDFNIDDENNEMDTVVIIAEEEDMDRIALASHRLGIAYGKAGNFPEAVTLLRQALEFYKRPRRLSQYLQQMYDHPLVKAAQKESDQYKQSTRPTLRGSYHQRCRGNLRACKDNASFVVT